MVFRVPYSLAMAVGVAAYDLAPPPALAYIDPISGSIIIQVIIAAILGGTVGAKRGWAAITGFFRRLFRRSPR